MWLYQSQGEEPSGERMDCSQEYEDSSNWHTNQRSGHWHSEGLVTQWLMGFYMIPTPEDCFWNFLGERTGYDFRTEIYTLIFCRVVKKII